MSSQVLVPANLAFSHKFSGLHLSGHLAMIRGVKSDALDDLCLLQNSRRPGDCCLLSQTGCPTLPEGIPLGKNSEKKLSLGRPLKGMNMRLLRGTSTLARASVWRVWQLQCQVIKLERNEDLPEVDFCSALVCYDSVGQNH